MDRAFAGASALVTGAASGIGLALVEALLRRGAHVYAADWDAASLTRLVQGVGSETSLTAVELDVRDESAVKATLDRMVEEHGRIDYVFNNAGIVVGGAFELMDRPTWERIVDINLWGVVNGTQHAYNHMVTQGSGHIVNTASTAGVVPVARSTAYATTKHAVVGLSTSLRREGARKGVKVSVVVPGMVATGIFASATNLGESNYAATMEKVPFGKITAEQAAEHILTGVLRNHAVIVFPFYNVVITLMYRLFPTLTASIINR